MLDIMIAIFLIYALFAGLVSGVNELIVQMLEMRGKVLFEGIAMMLGELPKPTGIINSLLRKLGFDKTVGATETKALYQHPLIDTLSQPGSKPSYISPTAFSAALVQVLSNDGSLIALRQKLDDRNATLGKLLGPMLDEANDDLEKFKTKVEFHFNEVMDRVGGWYKRRAQAVMFFIGLILAVFLNIDSIYIVQQLQENPAQVKKLVEEAAAIQASEAKKQNAAPVIPPGSKEGEKNATEEAKQQIEDLASRIDKLQNLGSPIGWVCSKQAPNQSPDLLDCFNYPVSQNPNLSLIGWLITALAGVFGAPFWFDAISKLFAIRGTGKKPEESTTTPATSSTPAIQVIVPPANNSAAADIPLNDFETSRLNSEDIEGLQRALGIPETRINGKWSEELRNALRDWQRITGRTVTGRFDEPTVLALLYPEA
ncbi:MAG: peptidoglycan-binding protein [Nitrosomonas sp.]|nr:peptidoglycan-binding protein [Nitrosomonas sp.]MBP6075852.1 peptidoglycan-binding protein [Nitrosomonas sp.]